MPQKKIRPDVIKRLKRDFATGRLKADALGKMRNIDSRKDYPMVTLYEFQNQNAWKKADFPGARVRAVKIAKNYKK